MASIGAASRLCFAAVAASFVVDYVARQKVGGTHINYFYLRQFPVLSPAALESPVLWAEGPLLDWLFPRALELTYTAHDLTPLARDCGYAGPPFRWDEARRFEIRCELDAAFFHLYLPCEPTGGWQRAEGETAEQLAAVQKHFPTPRDAVGFILDQFPIVRQKDEQAHGRYRTKERILEIYDAMRAAQQLGQPYQSTLDPPPGESS
jgi:hypothetical protein